MFTDHPLRLLPWSGSDGQPCYLSPDPSGSGRISRLADAVEAEQLADAEELLEYAALVLADQETAGPELHDLGRELSAALRTVLRVAESRGGRLPVVTGNDEGAGEEDEQE